MEKSYTDVIEGKERLKELQELIDGVENLTSKILIREGSLEKLNRDKYAHFHFILTNDAVIYCSQHGDKLKHNRTMPLRFLLVRLNKIFCNSY